MHARTSASLQTFAGTWSVFFVLRHANPQDLLHKVAKVGHGCCSGGDHAKALAICRPASAAPGATVNKSAQQDSKPPTTGDKGMEESSVGIASSALPTTDSITS